MPKTKITIVNINGRTDLHIGTFITDRVFQPQQPALVSRFEVDNVFLSILNSDNLHHA